MVSELLKKGKFEITALSREDSSAEAPAGVKLVKVNYNDEPSLIAALQGQQFLFISLGTLVPQQVLSNIIKAAGQAGVPYILPNIFTNDYENEELRAEDLVSSVALTRSKEVEDAGSSWIALVCGFWFEWSIALGEHGYGIDTKNKTATLFDDGKTYINTSTFAQTGRAVAELLSLPESGASPSLSDWKNKPLHVASFKVNQREMLDSVQRVTGTSDKDWQIGSEPAQQRYERGLGDFKQGKITGFVQALYSRVFYKGRGGGDYETVRGLDNAKLGLPREDLDVETKNAIDMIKAGFSPFGQN